MHRVLEATSLEGDDRRAGGKVLLLHDARGFEETRHEGVVGADVEQRAVGEEGVGVGPEAVGVAVSEGAHLPGALGGVRVLLVGHAADDHLHAAAVDVVQALKGVEDQVHALLLADAADERQHGHGRIGGAKVLFLQHALADGVRRRDLGDQLTALGDADTVRVRERARERAQERPQRRRVDAAGQEVLAVRERHRAPVGAGEQCAARGVDAQLARDRGIDDELARQVVNVREVVVALEVDLALVADLEIVHEVEEGRAAKDRAEGARAHGAVGRHEAREPVVGDDDRRQDLQLAAELERRLGDEHDGLELVRRRAGVVRRRKVVKVVEEVVLDAVLDAEMVADLERLVAHVHQHRALVLDALVLEVAGLAVAVKVVVRRDDGNVAPERHEVLRQLVDHDADAADGREASNLGRHEHERPERVALQNLVVQARHHLRTQVTALVRLELRSAHESEYGAAVDRMCCRGDRGRCGR